MFGRARSTLRTAYAIGATKAGDVSSRNVIAVRNPWLRVEVLQSPLRHRSLIATLVRRDIASRYRGSVLGLVWSLVNPLLMLVIYTFVFSAIFKMRWGAVSDNPLDFALMLFSGLLLFNFFAEAVNRAPGLVLGNPNLVKKLVFPLEIQAWVVVASGLFQAGISLLVLLAAIVAIRGEVPVTIVLLPLVFIPLTLIVLGLVWFISALAVFLRDIGQVVGHVVVMSMFLSPLFYPIDAIPERFRPLFYFNPLTLLIGEARKVTVLGEMPDWVGLGLYAGGSLLFATAGFWFFQRLKPGFSDVL